MLTENREFNEIYEQYKNPHLSSVTAYIFLKIFNSLILSNFPLKSCRFSTVPDLKLY